MSMSIPRPPLPPMPQNTATSVTTAVPAIKSNTRVELPVVTEATPENKHVSLLLIADGLRQAEANLKQQEENIRKLTEQLNNLQNMRIASMAQRNLLIELEKRITELEQAAMLTKPDSSSEESSAAPV